MRMLCLIGGRERQRNRCHAEEFEIYNNFSLGSGTSACPVMLFLSFCFRLGDAASCTLLARTLKTLLPILCDDCIYYLLQEWTKILSNQSPNNVHFFSVLLFSLLREQTCLRMCPYKRLREQKLNEML